jgi:ABC-type antimicrobial peptide transport system permease subunit
MFQVFAAVALLLAAAGIYGVLAGSVTERTREIGIRTALGASRRGVLSLVVRQGLLLTGAGLAIGTVGALALSRLLDRMLFGVGARDPATFIVVVVVLLVVALAASWAPAWRATRVSPLEALRSE